MLTRRDILKSAIYLPFAVELLSQNANAEEAEFPISGQVTPGFESIDYQMAKWLRENQKPGGVLVISYLGRLIYARGFGYADNKIHRPFLATTPFRYGSVAKWFTAMAFMRLVEQGVVRLDAAITACQPLIPLLTPAMLADPLLPKLTFRNLLSHKSGLKCTYRINDGKIVSLEEWVRGGLAEGFKWTPGSQFDYSNFNYILAQFLLEKLSNRSYDAFLQDEILKPAGVRNITLAGLHPEDRLSDESQYYVMGNSKGKSIWLQDNGKQIDAAYNIDLRTAAGMGGYRGSALTLLRLMSEFSLDGKKPPLTPASVWEIIDGKSLQNPPCNTHGLALGAGSDFKDSYWWGTGGMTPGMTTTLTRRADTTIYVFAFNSNNDIDPGNDSLNKIILQTLDTIHDKPQFDLWEKYSQ